MEHVGRNQYLFGTKYCWGIDPYARKEETQIPRIEHMGRKKIPFLEHTTADDCSLPISGYMVFVHGTRREKKQIHSWIITLLTTVPCLYPDTWKDLTQEIKYISWNIPPLTTVPCLDPDPREGGTQIRGGELFH
jgi:hypothetical protein